ncbi:MAG: hypothetical protein R6W77_11040 [Trueperaceae bacterium]
MNEPALWNLALQAFAAVIVVLTALAGAVALLSLAFRSAPAQPAAVLAGRDGPSASPPDTSSEPSPDPFVTAAIHVAVRELAPGARVTRIKEIR